MSEGTRDGTPLLEVDNITKYFGTVIAIKDISMSVRAGEVMCVLGDNGAGKSTLIKTLSGVHQPSEGRYLIEGEEVRLSSPRDALSRGIATVYQDLAMIPLLSIWRNFFLGSEPTRGWGPWRRFDVDFAQRTAREELQKMGIDIRDTAQPVGTLSGGERQSVAIARAVYFGAKVLILDEPTSALGVKQAGVVLRYIVQHAYPVGDRFTILNRGRSYGTFNKAELSRDELVQMMAGGKELEELGHELDEFARAEGESEEARALRSAAHVLEEEAKG
jgi:simple sugar transport system ATP-binding protein